MKIAVRKIAITFVVLLVMLLIGKVLRTQLTPVVGSGDLARLYTGVIVRLPFVFVLVMLVRRFQYTAFSSFHAPFKFRNLQALAVPVVIVGFGIMASWSNYQKADSIVLLLFLLSQILVGFNEEIAFRAIIFPALIEGFGNEKRGIYLAAVVSSLLFGMIHYVNLIWQPGNFIGVTSQVIFATAIGLVFCGLLLRLQNIIYVSLFHGLINIAFGAKQLSGVEETVSSSDDLTLNVIIPTLIFYVFIAISGFVMLRLSNREEIFSKLKKEKAADHSLVDQQP